MNQSQNTLEAKQAGDLFHQIPKFILRLLKSVGHWGRNRQIDPWNRTKSFDCLVYDRSGVADHWGRRDHLIVALGQ